MFRSSNDGGASFSDKINLSNTTNADSQDVEIAADGDNVIVTWWERNQTAEEPIVRISTDNGETFGPILKLATMELSDKQPNKNSNRSVSSFLRISVIGSVTIDRIYPALIA